MDSPKATTAQEISDEDKLCPKCNLPSIRVLRNILSGDQPQCIGIPTCMNVRCMYISPNLKKLEMPMLRLDNNEPMPKAQGTTQEDPDAFLLSVYTEYGRNLKDPPKYLKPAPLPVDEVSMNRFKGLDENHFCLFLKKAFPYGIPEIPD